MAMEESRTAVLAALLGNLALAILKGISAAVTGSAAMMAETFHSCADTGNQALLFVGMRLSRRPPDERHPFGHGKNVYFWAFVVSIMLFTLGGAFSVREGVHKLLNPGQAQPMRWALVILAGSRRPAVRCASTSRRTATPRCSRSCWRTARPSSRWRSRPRGSA
jgi:cation diffusion facilitator family transporter